MFTRLVSILFGLVFLSISFTCTLEAASYNLFASSDQYVYTTHPDTSFGSDPVTASEQGSQPGGDIVYSYYRFDFSSIPTGSVITQAFLYLYFNGTTHEHTTVGTHEIYSLDDDSWDPAILTWNNQPYGFSSIKPSTLPSGVNYISSTSILNATPGFVSWDVTSALTGTAGLNGINNILSLLLTPSHTSNSSFGIHITSIEGDSNLTPIIFVETSPVPIPASILLLGTGMASLLGVRFRRK